MVRFHCGVNLVLNILISGVETIHAAIGENASILVQWMSTFLTAIVIGMVRIYSLAFLLLALVPLIPLLRHILWKVGDHQSL